MGQACNWLALAILLCLPVMHEWCSCWTHKLTALVVVQVIWAT